MLSNKHRGNRNPLKKWKPGQSGNPKGRPPKADCLLSCIKDELSKASPWPDKTNEQLIAEMLVAQATKGNLKAAELVLEYTTVKPKAELDLNAKGTLELLVRWDGNKHVAGDTPAASTPTPG